MNWCVYTLNSVDILSLEEYTIVYASKALVRIPVIALEKNAAKVHLKYDYTQIKDKCKFFSFRCGLSLAMGSSGAETTVQRRLEIIRKLIMTEVTDHPPFRVQT